jgi:iron complex outermembrane receptor protein
MHREEERGFLMSYRNNRLYSRMFATASLCAMAVATPAFAQSDAPAAGAAEASDPNDIIVTAQRRSEKLENVPMAITAVTPETLQKSGVENFTDIGKVASGIQLNYAGSVPGVAIRGITSVISGYTIESNVAIYIDGMYDPQPVTMAADMANVQSVQVLKGPQGTLYGRNATGGAVLVETLGPSRNFTGKVDASYAKYNVATGNAYVAGPLSDTIRFSLSGHIRDGDLYLKKAAKLPSGAQTTGTTGKADDFNYLNLRGKLEFDLGENLTALVGVNHSKIDDPRANYFSTYAHAPATVTPVLAYGVVAFNDSHNKYTASTNEATLRLTLDTGLGTLVSNTGYARRKILVDLDFDGTYADTVDIKTNYRQKTFQTSLDYNIDAIDRLALNIGGMYYRDDTLQPVNGFGIFTYSGGTLTTAAPIVSIQNTNARTRSWAVYADGTFDLTPKLHLTVGGRYAYDKKQFDSVTRVPSGTVISPFLSDSHHWGQFTPRGVLRYEIFDRTSLYASITRGYRSGAYNPSGTVAGTLNPVNPEKITSYEGGFKSVLLDNSLRINGSIFQYDYTDLQVTVTVPSPINPAVVVSRIQNAKSAKVTGAEGDIAYSPTQNLTLRGAITLLKGRYGSFTNATGTGVNPATGLNAGGQIQDWTGQQLPRAPKYSGNVGFDYTLPTSIGKFGLTSNLNFTSSYALSNPSVFGPGNPNPSQQRLRQSHYTLISAQISWTDSSDRITATVFGNNLTNKTYRLTYNAGTFGDYSVKAEPITYGVRLGYKF